VRGTAKFESFALAPIEVGPGLRLGIDGLAIELRDRCRR
jgi:hypothetical protein